MTEQYGKLPLQFEVNRGQHDGRAKFLSRGRGFNLILAATEARMVFSEPGSYVKGADRQTQTIEARSNSKGSLTTLRMRMLGANEQAQILGVDELPGKTNYLLGNNPRYWQTNVPNYQKVVYKDLYHGVDMVYRGNQRQLEYDFIVAPGSDAAVISLAFDGARSVKIDKNGDLLLKVTSGVVRQHKPLIYQDVDGTRRMIDGSYHLKGKGKSVLL